MFTLLSGTRRDGKRQITSPSEPRGCRLVARTWIVVLTARTPSTSWATPSTRCSQLSKMSRRCLSAKKARRRSSNDGADSLRDRTAPTAATTPAGSASAASSTNHTPSGNAGKMRSPTSMARRVFPQPFAPTIVTSCRSPIRSPTSCSCLSRPRNRVRRTGRLCLGGVIVRSGGKESAPPDQHT